MSKFESATTENPPPSGERENLSATGGLRRVTITGALGTHQHTENLGSSDPYLGATIDGRYLVERVLGEGGMGVVYRCRHTIIDKLVAMKVLRADMARNEEVTERFLNEARSASSIGNPHIIDISDFGRLPDGATYFIMEHLDGSPLAAVLEQHKALPIERLLHISSQIADGLAAAHERGIIHRDLKPDNVFVLRRGSQSDFVKILDFGIAKATTTGSKLTQAGQVFGTPHYMSPEQASGTTVDARSDIYSLGVMMYEMASGRLPFDADNFMAILTQHMYKEPTPLRELPDLNQPISIELEAIILKTMSKKPEDRYQSMSELSADLATLASGLVPSAVRDMASRPDKAFELPPGYVGTSRAQTSHESPRSKSPTWLPFALLGAVAFSGTITFIALRKPEAKRPSETSGLVAKAPQAEPVIPAKVSEKQVAVAVSPIDAHVFRGETDLGTSPVLVLVGATPVVLRIEQKGYLERELTIDGLEEKVSVTLDKVKASTKPVTGTGKPPAPTTTTKSTATKKKSSLGSDIVNPWD